MHNSAAMWKQALRNDLKDLLTRYGATLSVQDGKMIPDVDARN